MNLCTTPTHVGVFAFIRKKEMIEDVLDKAFELASNAHRGQKRRDGITAYIAHPTRVADKLERKGAGIDIIAAAYLHDVLEMTSIKAQDLVGAGFSTEIVEAVVALTKKENESYPEYLVKVKANDIAKQVKIMDMLDNLRDDPSPSQIGKYARGLTYLLENSDRNI
jgi:(p)ppGpp synthase/HD superfamily hydrolase